MSDLPEHLRDPDSIELTLLIPELDSGIYDNRAYVLVKVQHGSIPDTLSHLTDGGFTVETMDRNRLYETHGRKVGRWGYYLHHTDTVERPRARFPGLDQYIIATLITKKLRRVIRQCVDRLHKKPRYPRSLGTLILYSHVLVYYRGGVDISIEQVVRVHRKVISRLNAKAEVDVRIPEHKTIRETCFWPYDLRPP